MRRRLFTYGTAVLVLGVASLTLAWTIRAVFGLFYIEMVREFDWSRTAGTTGYAVSWLMLAAFSPALGWAIDRWGTGKVMAFGSGALAAALGLTATMESQWQYILYFGVLGALGINAMVMASGVLVPRWFVRNRGAAMGVVAVGNSVGPLVFFPVFQLYISTAGWREPLVAYTVSPCSCSAPSPGFWSGNRRPPPPSPAITARQAVSYQWHRPKDQSSSKGSMAHTRCAMHSQVAVTGHCSCCTCSEWSVIRF